ncbi:hypothetical protein [Halocatena marina]|uniref:Uncharacterized protein n=1 Tax=Halocatena marina TaxID=2934937 RepID=A0ABD5YWQ8_9EURY|nr:hypothetical protein [Halocatena marina]
MVEYPSTDNDIMSKETSLNAEPTNETESYPDQNWGKVALCVGVAIIAALGAHYVLFEVVSGATNLSSTVHALIGMVLFFIAGFVSFSVLY